MDKAFSEHPIVAVNGIILQQPDRVLLTLRRDVPMWCVPGGLVEFGESVVEAVLRELREEIGVEARSIRCTGIYSEPNLEIVSPARGPLIILAFECQIVSGLPGCSEEVAGVEYFSISSLPRAIVPRHRERVMDALRGYTSPVIT